MNVNVGEVYTFKLNSGEELIARVEKIDGTELVLAEPVSVAPGPQGMGLMPSMFTAKPSAEARLNTNAVSIYALTDESVKSKYVHALSGIIVPEKKLILG